MKEEEAYTKLVQELRRGTIVLAVLAQLRREHYAYSLRQALQDAGLAVDEGTLYPLVRRLEKQGLLTSEWREDSNRRRRYYWLTDNGLRVLDRLLTDWTEMHGVIVALNGEHS